MSEGEQTIAEGRAPELAVEPHQAVVVGEPQEEAAPVLGEPVPLANGLQGDSATPPPGAEEPTVNGVQEVSHPHHHQDEASVHDQEEGLDPPRSFEGSPISSESPAEVNPTPSEVPAEENSNPPNTPAEETLSPSDAPVEETSCAPDAPAEETSCASDAPADENPSVAEEPNATVPPADAADVSAESPGPVEVSPEIPTENLYLPSEEASAAQKDAPSVTLTKSEEESLIEAPLVSAASDEEAFPTQVEISHEGSGASHATQQEGLPVEEATASPEPSTEEPALSEIVLEGVPATGSKVSEVAHEEVLAAESAQISQRDAPLQEAVASDIVPEKPMDEEAEEIKLTEEVPCVEGTKIIDSRGEFHARGPDEAPYDGSSVDPSLEVAHVTSKEVCQDEGSTNGDQIPQKDALHEDATFLDSHQVLNHAESSVEAVVMSSFETPIPSQTTREIPVEEYAPGQSSTREPLAKESTLKQTPPEGAESSQDRVPAENGENGFQSVEDANNVVEREQDFSKDDEDAEGKEKPISRIKLPLIVTGLAIAAVGVAVASISRTH